MAVQDSNKHKKRDVSSGEIVDKQTRGNISFGVGTDGKAYPINVNPSGAQDAATFSKILSVMVTMSGQLEDIKLHLEKITELNS